MIWNETKFEILGKIYLNISDTFISYSHWSSQMFSFLTRGKNKIKTYHAGFSSKKKGKCCVFTFRKYVLGCWKYQNFFFRYLKYFLKYLKELKTVKIKYLITTIIKNSTIAFSEKFDLTLNLFSLKDKGDHFLYTICFFT